MHFLSHLHIEIDRLGGVKYFFGRNSRMHQFASLKEPLSHFRLDVRH